MSLTLADIGALRTQLYDPVAVGEFPNLIRVTLGLPVPIVYLSNQSLEHIAKRHPDVTDFDLLLLPFVIRHGLILRENKRPNIILAAYQVPMSQRRFVAVMKITGGKTEVWLSSFYRTKPSQTKQLLKKTKILKYHD